MVLKSWSNGQLFVIEIKVMADIDANTELYLKNAINGIQLLEA